MKERLRECVRVKDLVPETLEVRVSVGEGVNEKVRLGERLAVKLGLSDSVGDNVGEMVIDGVGVPGPGQYVQTTSLYEVPSESGLWSAPSVQWECGRHRTEPEAALA